MVGCAIRLKKIKPEWVSNLLSSEFFGSCEDHNDLRKNEINMFCIDCSLGFCKHCMTTSQSCSSSSSSSSPHCFHRWLQICKYVYHYVVRLQDIQEHLDCSRIQTYKINGEKAVHLNPRPHSKDNKISKSKGGASCQACGRHIQDLPNSFCSIACKVSVVPEMYKERNYKMIPIPLSEFNNLSFTNNYDFDDNNYLQDNAQNIMCILKPKKQSLKRKGIPRRSPLH